MPTQHTAKSQPFFAGAHALMTAREGLASLLPSLRPLATAEGFDDHVVLCASVAVGRSPPAEAERSGSAAGLPAEATSALVALFLDSARLGVPTDELSAALSSVLPPERASAIAGIATQGQPTLRGALESLSLDVDELVDVSWTRATMAAAGLEQPRPGGTALYTISLTLRAADGATRPLQFTANIEELHELVSTLKSAMRAVEREVES
jgi:hypothetical protein